MKNCNRPTRPLRWTLLALALAATGAHAQDSGLGVDLHFGNGLDPTGGSAQACDPDGATWIAGDRKRTPTGFLYACPQDRGEPQPWASGSWVGAARVSLGYAHLSGDENNTQWRRFNDYEDGLLFGAQFQAYRTADGSYADLRASRVSDNNQYVRALLGRAGQYRIQAFYRTQSNVTSGNAKSIWDGLGSNHLSLKPGLVPAGSSVADVQAVSAATPEHRLRVVRDKLGLGINYYFSPRWTGYFNASHEQRKGSRPFGGPFFFNYPFPSNGGIYELPRPIDDSTINFNGGIRFAGNAWRGELTYTGSFFRNKHAAWTYEVPFGLWSVVPGVVAPPRPLGEFAYEPENDYHRIGGNLTRKFNGGEFSASAAVGRMSQDEALLAPMNCTGQFGLPIGPGFLLDCADWNTADALSQKSADLRIDTQRFTAKLVMQPSASFTWRISADYNDQDYKGDYLAYNPLTGHYGYIAENGSMGSVVPNELGVWHPTLSPTVTTRIRNLTLDKTTTDVTAGMDWRIGRRNAIGASYTRLETDRTHREVATTTDDIVRLNWNLLAYDWLTFRANYQYLDRSGTEYDFHTPYEHTFSSSLPGYIATPTTSWPHTVDALRKYDVASRTQHKIDLMATITLPHQMTLYTSLRADNTDYDAVLGRHGYDTLGYSLQWEWQASAKTTASAWYGYDRSELRMSNVNDSGNFASPVFGGVTYPFDRQWWMDDTQHNNYAGVNFNTRVGRAKLDAAWNYTQSKGVTSYRFAGPGALAVPAMAAGGAGKFPDMTMRLNTLNVGLTIPFTPRFNMRVFNIHEVGSIFDWHYLGFDQSRVQDHRVQTDGGPSDYRANLFGVMLEAKL